MTDKTKAALIEEIARLRQRVAELERERMERTQTEQLIHNRQELALANQRLEEEITHREEAQQILQSIADATSMDVGADFFPSLVRYLATTINVRYAFVCENLDEPVTQVRTLAGWMGDHVETNIVYEVAGTPCKETVSGKRTFYPRRLQQLFPDDKILVTLGAESYCGLPVWDASGKVVGHLAILDDKEMDEDFSDLPALHIFASRAAGELHRKRAEEHARRQQDVLAHVTRVNMMGEIATGLAHEINQPLTSIAAYARAAQRALPSKISSSSRRLSGLLDKVMEQAARAGEIIRRLQAMVRKSAPHRSSANMNTLLQEALKLVEPDLRLNQIRLVLNLDESLPYVLIDQVQIQQVLLNLIRNAMDAMEATDSDQRNLIITTSPAGDDTIEVTVEDSGKGFVKKNVDQLFDAFYTTKKHGLGMGLAISRSIIEEHGGRLWTAPTSNHGAVFRFTVPIAV